MTKDSKRIDREPADDATERRFNETVRNLLNTPHKPHGKGSKSADKKKPEDARTSSGAPGQVKR